MNLERSQYIFLPDDGNFVCSVLFSHANGVAAQTYAHVMQKLSNLWRVRIVCYDIRGMGESLLPIGPAYASGKHDLWQVLVDDLVALFEKIIHTDDSRPHSWVFLGHSLGSWISLLAAPRCHVSRVTLLDMPLLAPKTSFLWTLAVLAKRRDLHSLGKVARRRKQFFPDFEKALHGFQKTAFFRDWPEERIRDYVRANYVTTQAGLKLRHERTWEADLFESMPANAASVFVQLPKAIRHHLNVCMLVGSKSEVCNPNAGSYFKMFFPRAKWLVLEGCGHMFPFEAEDEFLAKMQEIAPVQHKS